MIMADMTTDMRDRLGNIDQIRDLLFGQQMGDYARRFEIYNQRLDHIETQLNQLQEETSTRFEELQTSLTTEIRTAVDSIEKKLKYLTLSTHEETTKLQQSIKATDQKFTDEIREVTQTFATTTSGIQTDLGETKTKLEKDIQALRTQVFEELNKSFSNLAEAKVSRLDLAEVLFELCLKVKGTEYLPESSSVQAELMLPEQKKG